MKILQFLNTLLLAAILAALVSILVRMPQMPPTVGDFEKARFNANAVKALVTRKKCP